MKTFFSRAGRLLSIPLLLTTCAAAPLHGEESAEKPDAAANADAADNDPSITVPPPSSARDVLYGTISRLPYEPVTVYGKLIVRKPHGIEVRDPIPFSMTLEWGAQPPRATYELQDGFGRIYRTLRIEHPKKGPVKMTALDGEGNLLPEPSLTESVHGTDFSWLDISLSFLWWEDAELAGEDTFRGTLCDIVVVRPPVKIPGCSYMRLWVDRKRGFLRQAEQFDEGGKRTRWMWIGSVGKINDRWMIRTMEMKRASTGVQTKMQIDDLEMDN